jgi:integrase
MVLVFTGLRWEEAVAVLIGSVSLEGQSMTIERTASESGGRRDVYDDMKTRAAVRTVMIPDIAMPVVRRLIGRGAAGREQSDGGLYARLINGDRGGSVTRPGASTSASRTVTPQRTRTDLSGIRPTSCAMCARPCSLPPVRRTCR